MQDQASINYVLTLKDPRMLRELTASLAEAWSDLQNPFSLIYDEMLACGLSASVSSCLLRSSLSVDIASAGSCGEKAQLRVSARIDASAIERNRECLEGILLNVVFPSLRPTCDFEVHELDR